MQLNYKVGWRNPLGKLMSSSTWNSDVPYRQCSGRVQQFSLHWQGVVVKGEFNRRRFLSLSAGVEERGAIISGESKDPWCAMCSPLFPRNRRFGLHIVSDPAAPSIVHIAYSRPPTKSGSCANRLNCNSKWTQLQGCRVGKRFHPNKEVGPKYARWEHRWWQRGSLPVRN